MPLGRLHICQLSFFTWHMGISVNSQEYSRAWQYLVDITMQPFNTFTWPYACERQLWLFYNYLVFICSLVPRMYLGLECGQDVRASRWFWVQSQARPWDLVVGWCPSAYGRFTWSELHPGWAGSWPGAWGRFTWAKQVHYRKCEGASPRSSRVFTWNVRVLHQG
jgi:hypothetical protein